MRTRHNDTKILRCDERGCGVPFMEIKGDGIDTKIGLAQPRKVARDGKGQDQEGTCPRHE